MPEARNASLFSALHRKTEATPFSLALLDMTLEHVGLTAALADAGYDSEPNHRYAREECGVSAFIPAAHGRPSARLPAGRHRRRMRRRLNKHYGQYGQRWQVETGFSMIKRRLATAVNGRTYWAQCRELLLIAITYKTMLFQLIRGFLQSKSRPIFFLPSWDANTLQDGFQYKPQVVTARMWPCSTLKS